MQVKCQKEDCFGELEKVEITLEVFTELGLKKECPCYKCKNCGEVYFICETCEGEGFAETPHGHFDCEECNGSGVVNYIHTL